MNPEGFASEIIDLTSEFDMAEDYEINLLENIVVKARIDLEKGFVEIYRNFETDKIAFAWISNKERVYGADNTGG